MIRIQSLFASCAKAVAMALCILLGSCQALPPWLGRSSQASPQQELHYTDSREFSLLPGQTVVGSLYTIRLRDGDTLPDAARHYGLGYNDIVLANPGIDPWAPPAGSRVLLPMRHVLPDAPHEGVILNLANMRLFYFPPQDGGDHVYTYAVGIGREGWETPTGVTRIASKKMNPSWTPPASIRREQKNKGDPLPRVVPPGPDNPLGDFALRLSIPGYLIHGTNKPYGVGMRVSHGCVRLYPEDIENLFGRINVGNKVQIVNQPYLAGWLSGELYLEAHAPMKGQEKQAERLQKSLLARLDQEARKYGGAIDWSRVDKVLQRQDGIPTPILTNSPGLRKMVASAPELAHPARFYGQPVPGRLEADSWSIAVASFNDEFEARRVAAMLNHQGPPIPSRPLRSKQGYQVIAGPFKDSKEVQATAKRIHRDFEFNPQALAPGTFSGQ